MDWKHGEFSGSHSSLRHCGFSALRVPFTVFTLVFTAFSMPPNSALTKASMPPPERVTAKSLIGRYSPRQTVTTMYRVDTATDAGIMTSDAKSPDASSSCSFLMSASSSCGTSLSPGPMMLMLHLR